MPHLPVTVVGGVTADPELRFSTKGTAFVRFRVAAKGRVKDSDGNWTDGEPWYYGVTAFGHIAEHIAESVFRGTEVIIHGRLETNVWTDKDDNERRELAILADEVGLSLRWKDYAERESGGGRQAKAGEENQDVNSGGAPPF